MEFKILYQDTDLVVIDKPSGYHVHPPENDQWYVPPGKVILSALRKQINQYLFPVHRLDAPTSGVLIFALNKSSAKALCEQFSHSEILQKSYIAIVRGFTPQSGHIKIPLKSDSSTELLPAETYFRTLDRVEIAQPVGKKHSSARYSYLELNPKTGRFHQLRRHCAQSSHPIIGDIQHGDSYHNRFFRSTLNLKGLQLRCQQIVFCHPKEDRTLHIQTHLDPLPWRQLKHLATWGVDSCQDPDIELR